KAKGAAKRALELEEGLAEAHTALAGVLLYFDWDWQATEAELRRGIELNPSSALAHESYADYLIIVGRVEEGIRQSELAQELDPFSGDVKAGYGIALYAARRYSEAIERILKALELDPNQWYGRVWLAMAYGAQRQWPKALSEFQKLIQ